ncbi:hypothetical protein [Haloglomus litoreum]|uniref:hypothetical protein n=1 Tax=Haloglomus litoreum TaxID=3034026 RepID=UPI0023E8A42A|nr:hypothetical protein [Haloglomus sp. DT116]
MTHATPPPLLAPLQSFATTSPVAVAATLAVGLAVLLGLAIVGRVVSRYRAAPTPSLRALVVGISLVAAAPLGFLFVDVGVLPDRLRYVTGSLVQTVGLLTIIRGMYGPTGAGGSWAPRSIADLVVAALGVGTGTTVGAATVFLGGSGPLAAATLGVVVLGGTFVAGQAARAYRRRGDRRMLALSAGTLSLVVVPTPAALALLSRGTAAAALGYAGFFVLGQVLLLATLSDRADDGV